MSDWFDDLPNHPKYHDEVDIINPCKVCGNESIENYDNYYCSDNCLNDAEQELELLIDRLKAYDIEKVSKLVKSLIDS